MIRHLAAAAAVALSLAAGPTAVAHAQDANDARAAGERKMKTFDRLDRDRDGAVDRQEIETQRTRAFRRLDRDGDGVIGRDEIDRLAKRREAKRGGRGDRIRKTFERMDRDGDGRVTQSEYVEKMPRWLKRADADRDGRVTRAEFEAFAADREGKRSRRGKKDM